MGRKGWFYSVKKVFFSDSKKEQKHSPHHQQQHHPKPPKLGCFGAYHPDDLEGAPVAVVPSLPPRKEETSPKSVPENEQNNQAFSLVLATAVATGAAVAAAAEVSRLSNASRKSVISNEDMAATKIQTAYRGYLARRSLRGLRGLARLRTLVQGQSVQRQAATTLQCMQTLSRLQSQIRARKVRMSEENQTLNRQLMQKREREFDKLQANQIGEKWDDSSKSKEEVEAKLLQRQIAAMRREKAMAYASTHQQTWRNSAKSATNATFMDPNNPHWGWNWLERWMATRPWEDQNTTYHIGHASAKSAAKNTMSVGEITKLYSLRDQNNDVKSPSATKKATRTGSMESPPKRTGRASLSNGTRPKVSTGSWGGDADSKSMFNKVHENNRRHSIGVSPLNDDEIHSSSSPSTQVAKAKPSSKGRSASQRNTTPENAAASAPLKKRLSFPASPTGARRHSVSTRPGNVVSSSNRK